MEAILNPTLYQAVAAPNGGDDDNGMDGQAAVSSGSGGAQVGATEDEDPSVLMQKVRQHLNTAPFGLMVIIRQPLELFARAMRLLTHWHSGKFEEKQTRVAFKREDSDDPRALPRTYPVLEAAKQVLEKKFHDGATLLLEHCELWQHLLPANNQTRRWKSKHRIRIDIGCRVQHGALDWHAASAMPDSMLQGTHFCGGSGRARRAG